MNPCGFFCRRYYIVPSGPDCHPSREDIAFLSAYKNFSIQQLHHVMEWIKENVEEKVTHKSSKEKIKRM